MSYKIYLSEDRFIEFKEEKSILECLENNDITCDYSCRGGFCGVCSISKKRGSIYYNQEPIFETDENDILTCCSLPTSDLLLELSQRFF